MSVWPSTLRPPLLDGCEEVRAETSIVSQTETGPGKVRIRSVASVSDLSLVYQWSVADVAVFEDFYNNDLSYGSLPFTFIHPISGATVRARIVGSYTKTPVRSLGIFKISLKVKVLR